jgi:hypothetical protein
MDAFLTSNFAEVSSYHDNYVKYFKTDNSWKQEVEDDIVINNKLRVIQTFFNSPEECKSGKFKIQVLKQTDIDQMYPHLKKQASNIPSGKFLYIFCCLDGICKGHAFIADTIV